MVRIRKRGKTFSYIFEAGKKADGKRKVVEKGGFESKKAAYVALQRLLKNHLIPNLGDYSIQKLTPAVLDTFIRKLVIDGYSKGTT